MQGPEPWPDARGPHQHGASVRDREQVQAPVARKRHPARAAPSASRPVPGLTNGPTSGVLQADSRHVTSELADDWPDAQGAGDPAGGITHENPPDQTPGGFGSSLAGRGGQRCRSDSAATPALLSLALVLLRGRLVMAQALQIRKDAGLGHLALEASQRRLDAFVFADRDLGHEVLLGDAESGNVASARSRGSETRRWRRWRRGGATDG